MNDDEKTCPRCAETVKAAAQVCKHCQHEFGSPSLGAVPRQAGTNRGISSATAPNPKRNLFVVVAGGLVAVVTVAIFLGSIQSPTSQSGSNSSEPSEDAPSVVATAVTAYELAAAYNANEVAAQQKYGERTLDVTGLIVGVTLDFADDPVVQMQGVNQFLHVQASFDKSFGSHLAAFSKGQTITVRCSKITEVISAPMLSDCSIPPPVAAQPQPQEEVPAPASNDDAPRYSQSPEVRTQAPAAATTPPDIAKLVQQADLLNDKCRGGSGDLDATGQFCNQRDNLMEVLANKGWCYGTTDQIQADKQWQRCAQ